MTRRGGSSSSIKIYSFLARENLTMILHVRCTYIIIIWMCRYLDKIWTHDLCVGGAHADIISILYFFFDDLATCNDFKNIVWANKGFWQVKMVNSMVIMVFYFSFCFRNADLALCAPNSCMIQLSSMSVNLSNDSFFPIHLPFFTVDNVCKLHAILNKIYIHLVDLQRFTKRFCPFLNCVVSRRLFL